jgi:hypothetical protein
MRSSGEPGSPRCGAEDTSDDRAWSGHGAGPRALPPECEQLPGLPECRQDRAEHATCALAESLGSMRRARIPPHAGLAGAQGGVPDSSAATAPQPADDLPGVITSEASEPIPLLEGRVGTVTDAAITVARSRTPIAWRIREARWACMPSAGSPFPQMTVTPGSRTGPLHENALSGASQRVRGTRPRIPRTPTRGRVRLWPLPRPRPVKPRPPSVPGVRAATSWPCRTVPSPRGRGASGR